MIRRSGKPEALRLEQVRVVGLGQACVDYLAPVPVFPREDGKVQLPELHIKCGGPAATALVTLSRLGVSTSFVGSVSDDPFGDRIVKNLVNEQVDTSCLKITPGHTSQFAFIAVTEGSGKRTIFWHRGSVPHLAPADVDLSIFPKARVLHLDNLMIDASVEAALQARVRGIKVVMDAGTLREGSRELCTHVDVLIASRAFAYGLVSPDKNLRAALSALAGLGPREVVITLGDKGSLGTRGGAAVYQPAFHVPAADTTGAGDVYHGAYIYGMLQGWDMARNMRFASAAAALKCMRIGAQTGIPRLHEVERLLGANTGHRVSPLPS